MDTFSQGNFFFFLANSSIELVGSAPADNKNNTGSKLEDSAHIVSIGYDMGSVNSLPKAAPINYYVATSVLSSRKDRTKQSVMNAPNSFS
jgi:hypothetical protein